MHLIKLIRVKTPRKSGGFNTFLVDIVEISPAEFELRGFKVSEAKTSHYVVYGLLKTKHHTLDSDGERRERWWEEKFDTQALAEAAFDEKCKQWKIEGSKIVVPRKQKLYL